MMHSLVANEAALKVAVSYAEFPGNRSSRVIAAERVRGQDISRPSHRNRPGSVHLSLGMSNQRRPGLTCDEDST